jgi:hypothetical protein
MQLPLLFITCMACMSLGKNCERVDSRGRALSADARVCVRVRARACVHSVREQTVHACASRLHAPVSRAVAAGITWTSRTANAQWAARYSHTTVIDAAGAIYVIGGYAWNYVDTFYQDVWASTNGGERPDAVEGFPGGTTGVLRGTRRGSRRA